MKMPEKIATDDNFLTRVQRNHALEHATIHALSASHPRHAIVGRSDWSGFFLYGDVPTESVERAASSALARLRAGEHSLAVHPNCGTNLLTAATLACLASLAAFGRPGKTWRQQLERLPFALLAAAAGLVVARPLGLQVQRRLTTRGDPGTLRILSVERSPAALPVTHHIRTAA
jgi:hypothetical protein